MSEKMTTNERMDLYSQALSDKYWPTIKQDIINKVICADKIADLERGWVIVFETDEADEDVYNVFTFDGKYGSEMILEKIEGFIPIHKKSAMKLEGLYFQGKKIEVKVKETVTYKATFK